MSAVIERLTLRIAHGWAAIYTSGLPAEQHDARRAEIDSDIWEHCHDRRVAGAEDIGLEVLVRVVSGIPADVTWRIGQRHPGSGEQGHPQSTRWAQLVIPGLAALAVFLTLIAVPVVVAAVSAGLLAIALAVMLHGLVWSPSKAWIGTGAQMDIDRNRRRTTLLIVLAVSVIILTTTYAYAMSLDSWGDTRTVIFIGLGWASLATGVVSLILLVADAIRARRS